MVFTSSEQDRPSQSATKRPLRGLKEIGAYVGVSENTLRKYAREEAFPLQKVGGNWEATPEAIDAWRLGRGQ